MCTRKAGPWWRTELTHTPARHARDLAVVVDISPSMAVTDLGVSRLERVKLEWRELSPHLNGDRVALIVFSANAYITLPLTPDLAAVSYFVDLLDPGLVITNYESQGNISLRGVGTGDVGLGTDQSVAIHLSVQNRARAWRFDSAARIGRAPCAHRCWAAPCAGTATWPRRVNHCSWAAR